MKYLIVLLLGISIGIGGELLIPKSLYTVLNAKCIKDGQYIFMPSMDIYNPETDEYPIPLGGKAEPFVPSYRYAYSLLTKEISYLSREDCNNLIEKIIDREEKRNK